MNKNLVQRQLTSRYVRHAYTGAGFVLLACAMLASLVLLFFTRAQLMQAQSRLNSVQTEMQQVLVLEKQERAQAESGELMKQLFMQAEQQGLVRQDWNERKVNIASVGMSRKEVNDLLSDMTNSPQQIFGASQFEFSVRDTQSGLFEAPASSDKDELVVTLKGSAVFRTAHSPSVALTS